VGLDFPLGASAGNPVALEPDDFKEENMLKLTSLVVLILTSVAPVYAQAQPNVQLDQAPGLNPVAGAPTVNITKLILFKNTALTGVSVEWSVQKPTLTQITRFDVLVDVIYQNGKTQRTSKSITDGGARATSFDGFTGLAVKKTTAHITTTFTTPGNLSETENFTIGLASPPSSRPKPLDITQVTQVTQGCAANQACFQVKWITNANLPSLASFDGFNVKLDVNFSDGSVASGNANASANERQKIITVSRPRGAAPQTAKVTIQAAVTLRGQTSVEKVAP
jgi:hypothetical protein